jgi:branched-chain amino acid transport system ATP-binding protein
MSDKPQLLRLDNVQVYYDRSILALRGLSLSVPEGAIVALLGANGAGKSTTLKAISGLLRSEKGEVTEGSIEFAGERIDRKDASNIVRMGVFQVMEGRRVFPNLTVDENLVAGGHTVRDSRTLERRKGEVYHFFPRLKDRQRGRAGYLSGGEQQMLAIGRALMAGPRLLLLDEPSLGLSPLLGADILARVAQIRQEAGATVLLVEQNARAALSIADQGYVMENGRVILSGSSDELRGNEEVRRSYLGVGDQAVEAAGGPRRATSALG